MKDHTIIAQTPMPPYYAVIFTSMRNNNDRDAYNAMAEEMLLLATQQDGFLGVESAREQIGITVSYWKTLDAITQWKQHADHLLAQRYGREKWYASYKTRICYVERDYSFEANKIPKILVLCTGNSCRSQIAEGYLRHFVGKKALVYSAGIETYCLNKQAVQVMLEDGIDISRHTSNNIAEYNSLVFDSVITVCDHAKEQCPYFPAQTRQFHQNFPDPVKAIGTENEILEQFRHTRNLIKKYCGQFVKNYLNSEVFNK